MWGRLGVALGIGLLTAATGGSFAIGFAVGSLLAMLLFPINTEGARLEELKALTSSYAEPIPIIYGTARVGGTMIQAGRVREQKKTEKVGPGASSTTFEYYLTVAIAVSEGEIKDIVRIWADKEVILDKRPPDGELLFEQEEQLVYQRYKFKHRVYLGSEDQEPDPTLAAEAPDGLQPAYRGVAYIVIENFPLHKFGNRIPQFEFEVAGITDPLLPRLYGTSLFSTPENLDQNGEPIRYHMVMGTYNDPNSPYAYLIVEGTEAPSPNIGIWGQERGLALVKIDKWTGEVVHAVPMIYYTELEILLGTEEPDHWDAGRTFHKNMYPPLVMPWSANILFSCYTQGTENAVFGDVDKHPDVNWMLAFDPDTLEIVLKSPVHGPLRTNSLGIEQELTELTTLVTDEFGRTVVGLFLWAWGDPIFSPWNRDGFYGLNVWDVGTNQVEWYNLTELGFELDGGSLRCACFDRNGHLWIGAKHGELHHFLVVGTNLVRLNVYTPVTRYIVPYAETDSGSPNQYNGDLYGCTYVPSTDEILIWYTPPLRVFPDDTFGSRFSTPMGLMARWSVANKALSSDILEWTFDDRQDRAMVAAVWPRNGAWTDDPIFYSAGFWHYDVGHTSTFQSPVFPHPEPDPETGIRPGGFGYQLFLFNAETGEETYHPNSDWNETDPDTVYTFEFFDPWIEEMVEYEMYHNNTILTLGYYDPYTNAVWAKRVQAPSFGSWDDPVFNIGDMGGYTAYLFDRADPAGGVPLEVIVTDITNRVGGQPADYDYAALTQQVRGFVVDRRKPARAALEELQPVFAFDIVESDWLLKGVNRATQVPVLTIAEEFLVRSADDDLGFVIKRVNDRELPQAIDLGYFDQTRDYQLGNEVYRRPRNSQHSEDTKTLAAPVVMWPDEAATAGKRLLQAAWAERSEVGMVLASAYLSLEPGDLVLLERGGATFEYRITGQALGGNFALGIDGSSSDSGAYATVARGASGGGAGGGGGHYGSDGSWGYEEPTLTVTAQPTVYIVDTPLLRTADDNSGVYIGAGSATTGAWEGASIEVSYDGVTWEQVAVATGETIGGTTTSTLPAVDNWAVWDRTSTVRVHLRSGVLENRTEAQLLANAGVNLAMVGDELLQFATATPLGNNVWELSTLLRARIGTEAYLGSHGVGDTFLLIDAGALRTVDHEPSQDGMPVYYRASNDDAPISSSQPVQTEHSNRRLRCYAPYFIAGERAGDDLTITWLRRSRVPGRALHDSPLFEAEEAYEIDILDGSTVVRTIAAATMVASYTAAQQTADFGSPQAELDLRIYQLNATIGRGYPGSATL